MPWLTIVINCRVSDIFYNLEECHGRIGNNWKRLLLFLEEASLLVLVMLLRKNSYSVHLIGNSQRSLTGIKFLCQAKFVCMKLLVSCSRGVAPKGLGSLYSSWLGWRKQSFTHHCDLSIFIYIRILHCILKIIPLAIWNRTLLLHESCWQCENWGHKSSSSQWRIKINSLLSNSRMFTDSVISWRFTRSLSRSFTPLNPTKCLWIIWQEFFHSNFCVCRDSASWMHSFNFFNE